VTAREGSTVTITHNVSSIAATRPALTTLFFGVIGFVSGFLLSLVIAAYSFYSCTAIL
jgi:hypothetical protein